MRPKLFLKPNEPVTINVYLHVGQANCLKREAIRRGVSPSALIREMIDKMLPGEAVAPLPKEFR